jgi:HEAT repeat protein
MNSWHRWAAAATLLVLVSCQKEKLSERQKLVLRLRDARPAARIVAIQQLASHANKEETAAIVKAAADGSAEVRKAVATALAKVDADNAVDLAASMLRDPSDEVRAAVVATLAARGGPRAMAYLANAYASGGPAMRAAVLAAGPEVLAKAVQAEAKSWNASLDQRKVDALDTVKQDAVRELGISATTTALAELQARLVDSNSTVAAAACLGLAEAGAKDSVPAIIEAMASGRPQVVQGCAMALTVLEPGHAAELLLPLLGPADTMPGLLAAFERIELTPEAAAKLCDVARDFADARLALQAAELVGPNCAGKAPGHESWSTPEKLQVMTALAFKSPELLKQARAMLSSNDAYEAATGAGYLSVVGTPADGATLVKAALTELSALGAARSIEEEKAQQRKSILANRKDQEEQILRSVLGSKYEILRGKRPKGPADLMARLNREPGPDVAQTFEHRAGAVTFIRTATAAAARLKTSVLPIAEALFSEPDQRLRQLELELAEFLEAQGSRLRDRLRTSTEPDYRLGQFLNDLRMGREVPLAEVLQLAKAAHDGDRAELAMVLGGLGEKATPALLVLAELEDESLPDAIHALSSRPGAEVDRVLLRRLDDPKGVATVAAIRALEKRDNAAINSALVRAAVHPLPDVRAAALSVLASRRACSASASLKALGEDRVGIVRTAASALQESCLAAVTTP